LRDYTVIREALVVKVLGKMAKSASSVVDLRVTEEFPVNESGYYTL
jgi:hypothetical protein